MNVRLTRKAQADLDRIHPFISKESPEAASRIVTRLVELAWSLSDYPKEGRKTDEPSISVLIVLRMHHLVFYRLAAAEVQILHIRHTSRSEWRPTV